MLSSARLVSPPRRGPPPFSPGGGAGPAPARPRPGPPARVSRPGGGARAPRGPPGGRRRPPRSGFAGRRAGSGPARLPQAVVVGLARQVVEGVPEGVDVAPLDEGVGQRLARRRLEPGAVVRDREPHAVPAPLPQPGQEVLPRRAALAVRQLDRERPAPSLPVDPDRDLHRPAADGAGLAHLLVAGVEDQVGERLPEPPPGEGGEPLSGRLSTERWPRRRRRARTAPPRPPSPPAS